MSRYAVEETRRDGEAVVVLRDRQQGAEAQLWPGCGNNCFSLLLPAPVARGGLVTVVAAPPALEEIRRKPSWWGIPLLFPFPGRIPNGEYRFEGQPYRLGRPEQPVFSEASPVPGGQRDFHGAVMDLPWVVEAATGDDAGAEVRCALDTADHPAALEGFPFPYRVAAIYRLDGEGLTLRFRATNTGQGRLPFGLGAHPFLHLPLGEGGTPADCQVCVPGAQRWAQGGERQPVSEALDLRAPRPWVERAFNGMYTDLARSGGWVEAFVRDPVNGVEAVVRASPALRNVVVWSPPGRAELCLEPWSCPSNVFNLAARGVPDSGLVVLESGQSWECAVQLALRAAGG